MNGFSRALNLLTEGNSRPPAKRRPSRHFRFEPLEERTLLSFTAAIGQWAPPPTPPVAQLDPTNVAAIHFKAEFDTAIDPAGFTTDDVALSGTGTATVTSITNMNLGTDTIFDILVTATADGTVIADLPADKVENAAHDDTNAAATLLNDDNEVTYGATLAEVTVEQAPGQPELAVVNPIVEGSPTVRFKVTFSKDMDPESVLAAELELSTSLDPEDSLSVDALTQTVKKIDDKTYIFSITGFDAGEKGTLIATMPTGTVTDPEGNDNLESTSTDNEVTVDTTELTLTYAVPDAQDDPAATSPVNFTVTFSRPVVDFDADAVDVTTGEGTAFDSSDQAEVTVTGGGATYNVAVSGMIRDGVVQIEVLSFLVHDAWGNEASVAEEPGANTVTFNRPLTVVLEQAATQADPARDKTIHFTAKCSDPVVDFTPDKIDFTGSTNLGPLVAAIGAAPTYNSTTDTWDYDVAVTGMSGTTSTLVIANILSTNTLHDANGDAATINPSTDHQVTYSIIGSIGLYDPSSANFFLRNSNANGNPDENFIYGSSGAGWLTITGDWDGDGLDTVGLYDPTTSRFYLRNTNDDGVADVTFAYGPAKAGWLPIAGDWNGDDTDTVGLYDPKTSRFYLRNSNDVGVADVTFRYGPINVGWKPIAGDWNGDGTDTVGLYNPKISTFYLRNSNNAGVANVTFAYGPTNRGWKPIVGDWDGQYDATNHSNKDTVGLYDPTASVFYLRNANTSGVADTTFFFGAADGGFVPLAGYWQVPDSSSSLLAAGGAVAVAPGMVPLSQSALQPLVTEAIARWTAAGLSASTVSTLSSVHVVVTDLPGAHLGLAEGNTVYIDRDAAGHGWFVDPTPAADEEFTPSGSDRQGKAIDPRAVDRIDLLTVVEHELGHIAGLDDLSALSDSLMSGALGAGLRRTP